MPAWTTDALHHSATSPVVPQLPAISLLHLAIQAGRDPSLAELAFKALAESSIPCMDALQGCLPEVEASILDWERFAESLAKHQQFDALQLLQKHRTPDVRQAVARMFAQYGTRRHLELLRRAAADERDQYTLDRMAESLAKLERSADFACEPVTVVPLTPEERARIRIMVDEALNWRDAAALVELLSHSVEALRNHARAKLAGLGRAGVIALTTALDQLEPGEDLSSLWESLSFLDEELAMRRLRALVIAGQPPITPRIVGRLVQIGTPEVADILVLALRHQVDEPFEIYRAAIRQLSRFTLAPLSRACREEARILCREAKLLADIGGELVVDQFLNGLRDFDSDAVRNACAEGLMRCGKAAVTPLLAAFPRSDLYVRRTILRVLAPIDDSRAVRLVLDAAGSDGDEQGTAVERLGAITHLRLSGESTGLVLSAARSEREQSRLGAARALQYWDIDTALDPLIALVADKSERVRKAAFKGIERLASLGGDAPKVTRALIKLVTVSPHIQPWVIAVLEGIGDSRTIGQSVQEVHDLNPELRDALNRVQRLRAQHGEWLAAHPPMRLGLDSTIILGSTSNLSRDKQGPPPISDHVHFSVTAPSIVLAGTEMLLDVWAHVDTERAAVLARARQGQRESTLQLRSAGPAPVQRGTALQVEVSVPSLRFLDKDAIYWAGETSSCSFLVPVPADAMKAAHAGKVVLYLDDLRVPRLHFSIVVGDHGVEVEDRTLFEERTRTAFASYASENRDAVLARIQGMLKLLPELNVFLDVVSLRSGQDWARRVEEEIVTRDTFYLFWSRFARQSEWVKREWQIALERKGLDFIDPVPLEPPTSAPPPPELSRLHFSDWTLAVHRTDLPGARREGKHESE